MSLPLPEHLRDSVRIAWHLSNWCNYSCQYCGVLVFHKRSEETIQTHAFDHHSVDEWLRVLRDLPQREIYLKITGGEPFLDRANFLALLQGLTSDPRFTLRVDTNGSWNPAAFASLDKSRILLNISYHPSETEFEPYLKRITAIRAAGFQVSMVNFVLAPENLAEAERVLHRLEQEKFFVNVSAMIPSGAYASRNTRVSRELELLEDYNTPVDLHYRLVNPRTKGRLCYHPAFSYYMLWDGQIKVYCGGQMQNIFTAGPPALPREAVPCPYDQCESCVEMYRALADEPLVTRPVGLYPLSEYVEEVTQYRTGRRWKRRLRQARQMVTQLVGGSNGTTAPATRDGAIVFAEEIRPAPPLAQPITEHQPVFGTAAVFGNVDGFGIEARTRDRVAVSGWAASAGFGAPVREVRLRVGDKALGVIRHFRPRPDVVERMGRPELAQSGWYTLVYLPALAQGEYQIIATAVDQAGNQAELPPLALRIVD